VQILERLLQVLRVLLPRHAVNAWRRSLLQCVERRSQTVYIDVVKERGELHLLVPCCCFAYTIERTGRASPACVRCAFCFAVFPLARHLPSISSASVLAFVLPTVGAPLSVSGVSAFVPV
jgi:hypothetical protein